MHTSVTTSRNGPFKTYCTKAQDAWLRNYPGKTMSIYEIPGIVRTAWPQAATPTNITNAFKKTGICPYNPNVFTSEDYAPSFVTDRSLSDANSSQQAVQNKEPEPDPSNTAVLVQNDEPELSNNPILTQNDEQPGPSKTLVSVQEDIQPGLSNIRNTQQTVDNCRSPLLTLNANKDLAIFSPETVKPFPPPRLQKTSKRRIRKTAVLTDTPEKNALAEEQSKKKKKNSKEDRIIKRREKMLKKKVKEKVKKRVLQESESEPHTENDLESYCIICYDSYYNSQSKER